MVVTSLLTKIVPIAAVGLGLAFLYNVINKPGQASESAGALGQTLFSVGGGLGNIGGGINDFLTGIGEGSSKLLNPLFTLKTLFYGDDDTPEVILQENQITASNTTRSDPVVNTASDQPGVTPSAPATSTVTHSNVGGFSQTTTSSGPAATTTSSAGSYTSRAAGRATRFG